MNKPQRCPACGHKLTDTPPEKCPLCGFALGTKQPAAEDRTPYAVARANGQAGWHAMCEWVWFAGSHRVRHLALMRSSPASRHFVLLNLLVLAFAVAFQEGTHRGWREVRLLDAEDLHEPTGNGWVRAAERAPVGPAGDSLPTTVILWWNPAQAIVAWAVGFVLALGGSALLLAIVRVGASSCVDRKFRDEKRLGAALQYGTAWALPIAAGFFVSCLRPLAYVGNVADWAWYPPLRGVLLAAGTMVAIGAGLWWYWLIRVASGAPASSRARAIAFLAFVAPVLIIAAGVGWWFGMPVLYRSLFEAAGLI